MQTKITPTVEKEQVTYPYFGVINDKKSIIFIVLFLDDSEGVVVASEKNCGWKVGEMNYDWNESQFSPFKGTIEIS